MGLSAQVVNFRGLGGVDDVDQAVAVDQVPVVEDHLTLGYYNALCESCENKV